MDNIKEKVEKIINEIGERELEPNDIDTLGKLIDIHKDINEEEYWREKIMRYNRDDYDGMSYGRRRRDSRGRYMDSPRGGYKGHHMIDNMDDYYDRYNESRMYGDKSDTTKSLEYMLESIVCFVEMLEEDATNEDEINLIRRYTRKISEM